MSMTLLAAAAGCATVPANAQQPGVANIMVLVDDEDPDSVPASNNINRRVMFELRKQMMPEFEVLDNAAVLAELGGWKLDDRLSRSQKIAFAKAACKDGDATTCPRFLVFVNTRANVESRSFGSVAMARLEGDVVDVFNNKSLGNFDPVKEEFTGPLPCNDFCRDEVIGEHAHIISTELGAILKIKLEKALRMGVGTASSYSPPPADVWTDYAITFRGFSDREMESMIAAMDHVWDKGRGIVSASETRRQYRKQNYRSLVGISELRSLMYRLLLDAGYNERNSTITASGREMTVEKLFPNE